MMNQQTSATAQPETNGYEAALALFVEKTQARIEEEYITNYQVLVAQGRTPYLEVQSGKRYDKIMKHQKASRDAIQPQHSSVFCFVERATGDIFKAASTKAPAKHARGSIYTNNGQDAVDTYGARYLR